MKGIILTGGKGTRLYPASKTINKGLVKILNHPQSMASSKLVIPNFF